MAIGTPTVQVQWIDSLDEALVKAKETGKLVLLDFFNPG